MIVLANQWRSVPAVLVCLLLSAAGVNALQAQSSDGTATIAGTVQDIAGKPIPNAAVSVKNETSGATRAATTGTDGRWSIAGLPEGMYTIEASSPSFATSRRTGLKLTAAGSENVSMSLNVGELIQTVTVEGTVSVAAELAPSQSTLEARSAKSEISPDFIQNFASPVADYTELLNMAPGTFSVNPNGVGLVHRTY